MAYSIVSPPGLTSFMLIILGSLFSGGNPLVLDPGMVVSELLFYLAAYMLPEIALTAVLLRRGARRPGLALAVFAGANLVIGLAAFLSTLVCGYCGLPPRTG